MLTAIRNLFQPSAPVRQCQPRLGLEALQDRLVPATLSVASGVMTITGAASGGDNQVKILDLAGQVHVTLDGQTFKASNIRTINIDTKGGNDTVQYDRNETLGSSTVRDLNVTLGTGAYDKFIANLTGTLHGNVNLNVWGDPAGYAGVDDVKVTANALTIPWGASLDVNVDGGDGTDVLEFLYVGNVYGGMGIPLPAGRLTFDLDGGNGNDDVIAKVFNFAPPGGNVGQGNDPCKVSGGAGSDYLRLELHGAGYSFGRLDGGTGLNDRGYHTANVTADNLDFEDVV